MGRLRRACFVGLLLSLVIVKTNSSFSQNLEVIDYIPPVVENQLPVFEDQYGNVITGINGIESLRELLSYPEPITVLEQTGIETQHLPVSNNIVEPLEGLIVPASVLPAPPEYSFSSCTAFDLNDFFNALLPAQGSAACFNTFSDEPVKVVGVFQSIPVNANLDLYLYYFNHDTGELELRATSRQVGNSNEYASYVMPAGNYVIYAAAESNTASPTDLFEMGALGLSEYDAYEANDTSSTASAIFGSVVITGNTDYEFDQDYFVYTMDPAQSIINVTINATEHTLYVYDSEILNFRRFDIDSTSYPYQPPEGAGSTILFAMIDSDVVETGVYDPDTEYEFVLAREVAYLNPVNQVGEESLTRLLGYRSQVLTEGTFTGVARDESGARVPYGSVAVGIRYITSQPAAVWATNVLTADVNGHYSGTVTIPQCSGFETYASVRYETDGAPNPTCWAIRYHEFDLDTMFPGTPGLGKLKMNGVGLSKDLRDGGIDYYRICYEEPVNIINCTP